MLKEDIMRSLPVILAVILVVSSSFLYQKNNLITEKKSSETSSSKNKPDYEQKKWKGIPKIIDGDTVWFGKDKLRIQGMDAPESAQSCFKEGKEYYCGEESTKFMAKLFDDSETVCIADEKDKYGRWLATCHNKNNGNLAETMVKEGMAVSYYGFYIESEEKAKISKKGMWAGRFQRPSQWRRENKFQK